MLGMPTSCWTHLAWVSSGGNTYLRPTIIMINCPTLSAGIGGRDGMDGSRAYWMSFPFWETFQMWKFWWIWLRVLYLYRTRPYMVIILRVFWLVTPKMPVTPVILLHNLYSSRHWQPSLFVLIVQVLNSASTTATTPHVDTSPPSTTTTTAHSKSPRTTIHPRYCFFFL